MQAGVDMSPNDLDVPPLLQAGEVIDLGDNLLMQRPVRDLESGRWGAERIVIRDGTIRRARFMCRSYSPTELKAMLAGTGFDTVTFLGDGFERLVSVRR